MQFLGLLRYPAAAAGPFKGGPPKGGALPRLGFLSKEAAPWPPEVYAAQPVVQHPEELEENVWAVPTAAHAASVPLVASRPETPLVPAEGPDALEVDTVAVFRQQDHAVLDLSALRHLRRAAEAPPTPGRPAPPRADAARRPDRTFLLRQISAKDAELGRLLTATLPCGACREIGADLAAETQPACVAV
eukprot:EG_transcript_17689